MKTKPIPKARLPMSCAKDSPKCSAASACAIAIAAIPNTTSNPATSAVAASSSRGRVRRRRPSSSTCSYSFSGSCAMGTCLPRRRQLQTATAFDHSRLAASPQNPCDGVMATVRGLGLLVGAVRRLLRGSLPRPHESRLVGPHHRLHPIAQAELAKDAGDMGLHGRFADVELTCDLGVRSPLGEPEQRVALAW